MLKEIFHDSKHMYVAKLENGTFIIAYENGTAVDLSGRKYRHIAEYDGDENMTADGWVLAE